MVIKFILILVATFLTCMIYFHAALAAVSSLQPIRIKKKDERRNAARR